MKKLLISSLILAGSVIASYAAEKSTALVPYQKGANGARSDILFVDMTELYSQYHKAEESQKKFAAAMENAQSEINEMRKEGIALSESYEELKAKSNNPSLNETAQQKFKSQAEEKVKEIEEKQVAIVQYQQQASQTLAQRRQSVLNLHLNEIRDELAKIAKERGADFILNSSGVNVMYANEKFDITEEAIVRVNKTK